MGRFPVVAAALLLLAARPAASETPHAWLSLQTFPGAREQAALITSGDVLYLIGGWDGANALADVERFDPKTNAWRRSAPMPTARWMFAAGNARGLLYAAGGMNEGGRGFVSTLEVFDPAHDAWSGGAAMPSSRNMDGAVLDGKLYVVGGNDHGQCVARAEVYDPATGSWSELPSLPSARCGAATAAYGGRLYVLGGTDTSGGASLRNVDIYDPRTNAWTAGPPMPTHHRYFSAAVLDGRIYAIGGVLAREFTTAVESLDPSTGVWSIHEPLPTARANTAVAVLNGKLYAAGGRLSSGAQITDFLVYDSRLDRSIHRAPPPQDQAVDRPPRAVAPDPPAPPDVDGVAQRPGSRPDDFALVVGIDGYRTLPHAAYGESDATVFARYARQVLRVPEENVILLTGDKATRTDLAKYVEEWLPRNVTKDSRVYFYYSGHGAPDPAKGTAFLLPWDGDPEFLQSSAYPLARLYDRLDALPAKDVIVILDSCFSGAGGRSMIAKNLRPLVTVVATPRPGRRLSLLTASAGDEVAGSSDEKRHGLFTYYLLKGLQGDADVDRTGHVDLDELHAYVEKNVLRAAHRDNREQHPKLETSRPTLRLY